MKNILFFGDSFCGSHKDKDTTWPVILANLLERKQYCMCFGGCSWVSYYHYIDGLEKDVFDNSDIVVFCHTQYNRIPSHQFWEFAYDKKMISNNEYSELRKLYYKYFYDQQFLDFSETMWFNWISKHFENKKLVHLHSFDESINKINFLDGINIIPSLASISLKEEKNLDLSDDPRPNHFSIENNVVLANQLFEIISTNDKGTISLDISRFKLNNV